MTRLANAPTGWATFRALRKPPTPLPRRRHGNWVHGRYSRSRVEEMREVRRLIRTVRGTWRLSDLLEIDRPKPIGWKAYRAARGLEQARHRLCDSRLERVHRAPRPSPPPTARHIDRSAGTGTEFEGADGAGLLDQRASIAPLPCRFRDCFSTASGIIRSDFDER
jgi:hypothetical protein